MTAEAGEEVNTMREVRGLKKQYQLDMTIEAEELDEIFRKFEEAKRTMYQCCLDLDRLGVLTLKKREADSCN